MNSINRIAATAISLNLALLSLGCESAPKAGSMTHAVDHYNQQRYAQALQQAAAIQEKARPGDREDAAYLAGLAAYQIGDRDDAENRLMVASRSSNPETAAKAKVMMAQLRMDQHRPRDAATLFVEAAPGLQSEDAAKCAYNAGVAYQQSGDLVSARKWIAQSNGGGSPHATYSSPATTTRTKNSSPAIGTTQSASSAAAGFTLQVGAFREKKRAQQAAEEAYKLAARDSLGPVRLLTRRDDRGTAMYVVQFGKFPTRDAAAAARTKLGRLEYIVAPATAS